MFMLVIGIILGYLFIGMITAAIVYTIEQKGELSNDPLDILESSRPIAGALWPLTIAFGIFAGLFVGIIWVAGKMSKGFSWIYREVNNPKENVKEHNE